jgi:GNAT superfamily N-acetyltransferase
MTARLDARLAVVTGAGHEAGPAFAGRADTELGRHRAQLFAHCRRMLGSPFEAEDAVQVTLLRAWRGFDRFEGRASLRSWLYQSPEVTWMAVRSGERGQGIGRALVERAAAELTAEGAELLTVLTLGPSVPEPGVTDGYAGTRRFYLRCGFSCVIEFRPDGWRDVGLLLVRCLRHPDAHG